MICCSLLGLCLLTTHRHANTLLPEKSTIMYSWKEIIAHFYQTFFLISFLEWLLKFSFRFHWRYISVNQYCFWTGRLLLRINEGQKIKIDFSIMQNKLGVGSQIWTTTFCHFVVIQNTVVTRTDTVCWKSCPTDISCQDPAPTGWVALLYQQSMCT